MKTPPVIKWRNTSPKHASPQSDFSLTETLNRYISDEQRALTGAKRCLDPAAVRRPDLFVFSRWTSTTPRTWNVTADPEQIVIALSYQRSFAAIKSNGKHFYEGVLTRGTALVIPSGTAVSAAFHTPADYLLMSVPVGSLADWSADVDVAEMASRFASVPILVRDSVVTQLASTLLRTERALIPKSALYVDGLTLSMLARLLEKWIACTSTKRPRKPAVSPLEGWRVKIVTDLIDSRIRENLRLESLSAEVGLSSMHFAARFRAATGYSPHTFMMHRRVELAKTLLATTDASLPDIAISAGFRSQSHFTTVFRRHVDETPYRWRVKIASRAAVHLREK
jgi:AraC family transcriptional regulator